MNADGQPFVPKNGQAPHCDYSTTLDIGSTPAIARQADVLSYA
jgi:hypothetical protein